MKPARLFRLLTAAVAAFSAAALVACGTTSAPAPKPAPSVSTEIKSLLWVGNSFFYYNNSMHGHVGQLLGAAGVRGLRSSSATISGSGIDWHDVEAHLKPGSRVASYSFVGDNEVRFNTFDKPFDGVMMMDCSQCPIHPQMKDIFVTYAKKNSETARRNGARPVFFMSWAYQDVPAMTQQLADAYTRAGKENNAQVIPAGLAFARSIALRPDVNLYVADKRHPTLAGSYLAACTTYATLFRRSPIGLPYTAGLDPAVARHLQTVAWDTVQAYEKQ